MSYEMFFKTRTTGHLTYLEGGIWALTLVVFVFQGTNVSPVTWRNWALTGAMFGFLRQKISLFFEGV